MTIVTKGLLTIAICAGAVALSQRPADAAASCQFSGATIAFGSYNVYSTSAVAVTGTISGVCTNGWGSLQPVVSLDPGLHGTFAARKMKCASGTCSTAGYSTDTLQYNLYTTAGHSTVWGDGTGATAKVTLPSGCCGSNNNWSTNVFGLLPAAIAGGVNDSAVGVYGDTVVVTMTF